MRSLVRDEIFNHPGLQSVSYHTPFQEFSVGLETIIVPSGATFIELSYCGFRDSNIEAALRSQLEAYVESENHRLEAERQQWFDRYCAPFTKGGVYYASEYGFPPQPVASPDTRRIEIGTWWVTAQRILHRQFIEAEVRTQLITRSVDLKIPDLTPVISQNKGLAELWDGDEYYWYDDWDEGVSLLD